MEAPKCKICGEKHYGLCKGVVHRLSTEPVKGSDLLHGHTEPLVKFDRTAYQREYMRKKRAKDKAK